MGRKAGTNTVVLVCFFLWLIHYNSEARGNHLESNAQQSEEVDYELSILIAGRVLFCSATWATIWYKKSFTRLQITGAIVEERIPDHAPHFSENLILVPPPLLIVPQMLKSVFTNFQNILWRIPTPPRTEETIESSNGRAPPHFSECLIPPDTLSPPRFVYWFLRQLHLRESGFLTTFQPPLTKPPGLVAGQLDEHSRSPDAWRSTLSGCFIFPCKWRRKIR